MDAAIAAAGALLSYCSHTQQSTLPHVTGLRVERDSEFVLMDAPTRRNLEITETIAGAESPTLFSLLDRCATSMGSRRLRHWLHHPLRDTSELDARHAAIASLAHSTSRLRHRAWPSSSLRGRTSSASRRALRCEAHGPATWPDCATRSQHCPACMRPWPAAANRTGGGRADLAPADTCTRGSR
jgi:hypothetical protein